jgi:hypothetical protein
LDGFWVGLSDGLSVGFRSGFSEGLYGWAFRMASS